MIMRKRNQLLELEVTYSIIIHKYVKVILISSSLVGAFLANMIRAP